MEIGQPRVHHGDSSHESAGTVSARMYRFLLRPRWIAFHLLVLGAFVLMVNLGFWQLRRLDERQAFNDRVNERIDAPPVALADLVPSNAHVGDDVLGEVEWRPTQVHGEYLPDEQFVVVNRSQGGQPGEMVVTPMELGDGRVLLVERGFVPLDTDAAPPPSGDVTVRGRTRQSQAHRRGQVTDAAEGELAEVQRLDIARLAEQLPGRVIPVYLELTNSQPAETGPYPVPVLAPELTSGSHLSYAVQWFIFSLCAVVGWVFAVRKSARV